MVERMLRRGLPRVAGGDPWPPALAVEVADAPVASMSAADDGPAPVQDGPAQVQDGPSQVRAVPETPVSQSVEAAEVGPAAVSAAAGSAAVPETSMSVSPEAAETGPAAGMRRGLPRVAGGEAWPPAAASAPGPSASAPASAPAASAPALAAPASAPADSAPVVPETPAMSPAPPAEVGPLTPMRRGLPRVEGAEPWPPAGTAVRMSPAANEAAAAAQTSAPAAAQPSTAAAAQTSATAATPAKVSAPVQAVPAAASALVPALDVSTPLPFRRTVWQGTTPRHAVEPEAESSRFRPTWPQALAGLMGAAALGIIAGAGIALVRALLSMSFMQDFLAAFPGEYHLPEGTQPGFPAWIGWQHFFNVFLMVLIIRSGLRVRSEKRPTVFWAPRGNAKGKISLTLWFHQALDILWLVNGVIFVVLLFVSGHWVRIVPTSWEVFPNALSALLQYISFDWPTENGWVNYNSLQQLAYFTTVFIAAPLAAITGFRMSGMWPKKAEKLSKAYPVEWARALHFPIMLYFVAFIFVHVMLVVLTGFLRNLNHMYAAQDAVTWSGFWVFVASMVVIVGAWIAARPLVLAPIAKVFGNVSGR